MTAICKYSAFKTSPAAPFAIDTWSQLVDAPLAGQNLLYYNNTDVHSELFELGSMWQLTQTSLFLVYPHTQNLFTEVREFIDSKENRQMSASLGQALR